MRYIVTRARAPGATSNERHLEEVLRDCPSNYRLHSVVPVASGGGYTLFLHVIFEMIGA